MKEMKIHIKSRKLPFWIEQLGKEGYIVNIDPQKRRLNVTINLSLSKYLSIPFGQTRLNEFGG